MRPPTILAGILTNLILERAYVSNDSDYELMSVASRPCPEGRTPQHSFLSSGTYILSYFQYSLSLRGE